MLHAVSDHVKFFDHTRAASDPAHTGDTLDSVAHCPLVHTSFLGVREVLSGEASRKVSLLLAPTVHYPARSLAAPVEATLQPLEGSHSFGPLERKVLEQGLVVRNPHLTPHLVGRRRLASHQLCVVFGLWIVDVGEIEVAVLVPSRYSCPG